MPQKPAPVTRIVREGPRNGSDRTRRRPTKEGRDRARRRARRGTARSESRGPREETEADDRVLTLLVGVLHAVRKEAFNLRRLPEISPVVPVSRCVAVVTRSLRRLKLTMRPEQ